MVLPLKIVIQCTTQKKRRNRLAIGAFACQFDGRGFDFRSGKVLEINFSFFNTDASVSLVAGLIRYMVVSSHWLWMGSKRTSYNAYDKLPWQLPLSPSPYTACRYTYLHWLWRLIVGSTKRPWCHWCQVVSGFAVPLHKTAALEDNGSMISGPQLPSWPWLSGPARWRKHFNVQIHGLCRPVDVNNNTKYTIVYPHGIIVTSRWCVSTVLFFRSVYWQSSLSLWKPSRYWQSSNQKTGGFLVVIALFFVLCSFTRHTWFL